MNLALFDFDGTITSTDTWTPFMRMAVRPSRLRMAVVLLSPVIVGYRLGMPADGTYRELINTDNPVYGGSGVGNGPIASEPVPWHGRARSMVISVLSRVTMVWRV